MTIEDKHRERKRNKRKMKNLKLKLTKKNKKWIKPLKNRKVGAKNPNARIRN